MLSHLSLVKEIREFLHDVLHKNISKFAFIVSEMKKCPGFWSITLDQFCVARDTVSLAGETKL